MAKFIYSSKEDEKLIGNSYSYMEKMIFGTKADQVFASMRDLFNNAVEKVQIYPWGTITEDLNSRTPGICKILDNGKIAIEMWGYTNAPKNQRKWIEHEGVHEFCHAFADIFSTRSEKLVKKGKVFDDNGRKKVIDIVRQSHAGLIKETDKKTGKPVGRHYYGKMFNETMMDMISAMAINNFAPDITYTTIDDVLKHNYKTTGNQETGYTFFTSITRLMIAAFSTVGFQGSNSYQQIVDMGGNIFTINKNLEDGTSVRVNDFLYGIMYDPLHIEKEFDKYLGDDTYRLLCEFLDGSFMEYQRTGNLPADNVKMYMNLIADFCNKKMADCRKRGVISVDERDTMVDNFNKIWNSMYDEYGAYFSKEEVEDIYSRAQKFYNEE